MAAPGDVRKLTHLFETLGASSPDTTRKAFSSIGVYLTETAGLLGVAAGRDASMNKRPYYYTSNSGKPLVAPAPDITEEIPVSVPCDECSKDHPRYSDCPHKPCTVCYQLDHHSVYCPYNEGDSQLNSEQTVVYTPVGYSFMSGEQLVAPANLREEIPISVPCHECSKEHPRYSDCPYKPCTVCYQLDHPSVFCPYFRDIPQGAAFDRLRYGLFCSCGNLFNEDKWVCTFCPRRSPVLKCKQCVICNSSLEHSSWECPKDEVLAAEYREIREYMLSGAYSGVPIPPRGCGQMNEGKLIGSTK